MADPRLLASLDLMRRMPPSRMEASLEGTRHAATRFFSRGTPHHGRVDAAHRERLCVHWLPACAELVDLAPDLTDDLLNTVDQPLQTAKDAQANVYLLCDYNRDGDSYR